MHSGCSAGGTFIIPRARAAIIAVVVVHVGIVDDCCLVVNGRTVSVVISVHIAVIHSVVRQKGPIVSGNMNVDIDMNAGSHGCPPVITAATSPGNPGRSPLVAGNPCPSIIVIVIPSSVVERRPTPRVVRHPGVAVIGHHPISVGCVGVKVSSDIRNPHPAISSVVDPSAVRPQFVVKDIEADSAIITVGVIIIVVIIAVIVVSLRVQSSLRRDARRQQQCEYCKSQWVS